MNTLKMGQFQRDLEKLMEAYQTHPLLLVFEDEYRKIYFATAGNPSIEWIARATESFFKRLGENVQNHQMKGTRNGF